MAFIIQTAHLIVKVIFYVNNMFSCLDIKLAGFCQLQLSFGSDEEWNTDFLLQPCKVLAQGGLGNIQFFRRFCDVLFFSNGQDVIQIFSVRIGFLLCIMLVLVTQSLACLAVRHNHASMLLALLLLVTL